jgi:hypothetical protein
MQAIEAGGLRMRILSTLCGAALAVVASWTSAGATTLSGNLTADNLFDAYISTDDSVLGTLITSGNNWPTTVSFSGQGLTSGVTNYLHIVATDQGKPDMFIGSFSLSDSLFKFANGTQSLVTNATNWRSDTGGGAWFAPTGTPVDIGPNGTSPWGSFALMAGADFIWAAGDPTQSFFSTTITSVAATPIPAALPFFLSALGGLGLLAHKKRRATSV